MIKILTNEKVAVCPKCKSHMIYADDDIEIITEHYETYGGEYSQMTINKITCPKCKYNITIN